MISNHKEIWKPIEGYEGLYEVSSLGRVKSVRTGKNKVSVKNWKGYLRCQLWNEGKGKIFSVHRLVASAFIPNQDGLATVNHKDNCKTNNAVENLEWMSFKENHMHDAIQGRRALKLDKSSVIIIKRAKGMISSRKIAGFFGVNKQTIVEIWNNRIWNWV